MIISELFSHSLECIIYSGSDYIQSPELLYLFRKQKNKST